MASTPRRSWPTPDNTDRVADGASAMRALGDAIDNGLPVFEVIDDSVGSVTAGSTNTQTFSFAGSYAAAPVVIGTVKTGGIAVLTVSAITTSDCLVTIKNIGATGIAGSFSLLVIEV